jgi:hypothetical protein
LEQKKLKPLNTIRKQLIQLFSYEIRVKTYFIRTAALIPNGLFDPFGEELQYEQLKPPIRKGIK